MNDKDAKIQLLKIAKLINSFDYFSIANLPDFGNTCQSVFQKQLNNICSNNPRCSFTNNSKKVSSRGFVSEINFELTESDMNGNIFHKINFDFQTMFGKPETKQGEANVHIYSQMNGKKFNQKNFVFNVPIIGSNQYQKEKQAAQDLFYDIYRKIATSF